MTAASTASQEGQRATFGFPLPRGGGERRTLGFWARMK
jgi:hypothetical protein